MTQGSDGLEWSICMAWYGTGGEPVTRKLEVGAEEPVQCSASRSPVVLHAGAANVVCSPLPLRSWTVLVYTLF